jgi:hypothetical protein
MKLISFWYVLSAGALVLVLSGCAVATPPPAPAPTVPPTTPLPSPTAEPIHYRRYTPSEELEVHLEFDYADYWHFQEGTLEYTGTIVIGMADPAILDVPTRSPDEPHGTPSDLPRISIHIQPLEPGESFESLWQEQKRIDSTANILTLVRDYPLQIDGYDAYALETLNDIPELYMAVMFCRRIILVAYDQVYTIDFLINEQHRGDRFEQGYNHFFESLQVVP